MAVELLEPSRASRLRAERFTYPEVGHTACELPRGYRTVTRTTRLAAADFDDAAHALFRWRVQEHAGLHVAASSERLEQGSVVVLRLGFGPLAVRAPCRVVYVVEEPDRRGFAYGALPGHAESGEESFVLERGPAGKATFTITAFSRPAGLLAKCAGPLGRLAQDTVTTRYLRAFDA